MGALNPTHKSTLRFRPLRRIQCRCGNRNYLRCNIAIVNESSKGGVSQKSLYFLFYLLSKWSLLLLSAEEMKLSGLKRQNSFKTTVKTLERTAVFVSEFNFFFFLAAWRAPRVTQLTQNVGLKFVATIMTTDVKIF